MEGYFERMSDHIDLTPTYDLGDDLLKVIGEIVVSFGQLEHAVALAIKRTSPMTLEEAQALTNGVVERSTHAQESFEKWAMNQNLEGEFKQLMGQVRGLARRRNDVVHGLWGKDPQGRVQWLRNAGGEEIKIDRLESLRDEIQRLTLDINRTTRPGSGGLSANPTSFD